MKSSEAQQTPGPKLESLPAEASVLPSQDPTNLVPTLVAKVYEEAPLAVRSRLLEHLLKPLGLLSLAAVANGVFAQIASHHGWSTLRMNSDEVRSVDTGDVMALVTHVQQVSVHAVDSLSKVISASPVLSGSAAAAMLLTLLAKQARNRTPVVSNDFDPIV